MQYCMSPYRTYIYGTLGQAAGCTCSVMDASWLLFSSHLHRILVRRFVRWQSMGEELLEQIGIMSLSNVWMTPVIALPSVQYPTAEKPNPKGRKTGYVLDSVDEVDLPSR
jgi:hypothetical protein